MSVIIEETGESFRDIWAMIEPNLNEAANLRLRAQLMLAVKRRFKEWGTTQKEAAERLGINRKRSTLATELFRRPPQAGEQLTLI